MSTKLTNPNGLGTEFGNPTATQVYDGVPDMKNILPPDIDWFTLKAIAEEPNKLLEELTFKPDEDDIEEHDTDALDRLILENEQRQQRKNAERVCYMSAIFNGIMLAAEGTRVTQQLEATVELPEHIQMDKAIKADVKRERKALKRLTQRKTS